MYVLVPPQRSSGQGEKLKEEVDELAAEGGEEQSKRREKQTFWFQILWR
jgi:hypothetical protein